LIEVNERGLSIKKEYQRRMKRLKSYTFIVGKLKAAQERGENKRKMKEKVTSEI